MSRHSDGKSGKVYLKSKQEPRCSISFSSPYLLSYKSYKNPLYCNNEKSPWNKSSSYYYYPVKIFFVSDWLKSHAQFIAPPGRNPEETCICRKVLTVEICSQPLKKKSRFAWSGAAWSRWVIKWWHFICSRPQARDFLGSRKTDYGAEWLLFSGHCTYSRVRSIGGAWTESLSLVEVCAAFPL